MTLLAQLGGGFVQALSWIIGFLFVLTVVVFFHELGHFLVARWCGVKVKAFSIGFGREIWGFDDRQGTRWKLCWIPLGGYVKFIDDESAASTPDRKAADQMTEDERRHTFHGKPVWQRAAVVAAGPIANFILAVVIFALFFMVKGAQIVPPKVGEVVAGGAAAAAGFKAGDHIIAIDGKGIESFGELRQIVGTSAGRELTFTVDRGPTRVDIKATPRLTEKKGPFNTTVREGVLGITSPKIDQVIYKRYGPVEALGQGVGQTVFIITYTMEYLGRVFSFREKADQLGGPLMIAEVAGEAARTGIFELLYVAGVISVSIGLMNLFPIPLLDGGHLMFYAIEAIRRRPLSERAQEIGFRIGLAVVLVLFVVAMKNDLVRQLSRAFG